MYRVTTYNNDDKTVEEFKDEDEMRDAVSIALDDVENHDIKSFTVSWLVEKSHTSYDSKPFWEK